jgi:hypothetical protein
MKSKFLPLVLSVIALIASVVSLTSSSDESSSISKVLVVTHGVVTPTATSGSGIGTIRTFNIPIAVDGMEADDQYLLGTLTTLEVGVNGDEELRSANLNFVLGGESNQVVLGGISLYPPAGATIAPGDETIRPIIGGSGLYAGAAGQVVSKNLGDEGWSHVLSITLP